MTDTAQRLREREHRCDKCGLVPVERKLTNPFRNPITGVLYDRVYFHQCNPEVGTMYQVRRNV